MKRYFVYHSYGCSKDTEWESYETPFTCEGCGEQAVPYVQLEEAKAREAELRRLLTETIDSLRHSAKWLHEQQEGRYASDAEGMMNDAERAEKQATLYQMNAEKEE